MSESNENIGGGTGKFLAIGMACFLIFGGCILCGGGLTVPFVLRRQAVERQRAEAERQFQKMQEAQEAMQKAAQNAAERQSNDLPGGDSNDSPEHE